MSSVGVDGKLMSLEDEANLRKTLKLETFEELKIDTTHDFFAARAKAKRSKENEPKGFGI